MKDQVEISLYVRSSSVNDGEKIRGSSEGLEEMVEILFCLRMRRHRLGKVVRDCKEEMEVIKLSSRISEVRVGFNEWAERLV